MNVLIVTVLASHSPSGVVTYYKKLAHDLISQGVSVSIIDPSDAPVFWRKILGILKRVMPIFGNTGRAVYYQFALFTGIYLAARRKRGAKIDLIHAQDPESGAAAFLALGKKVPVILSCHFNDDPASETIGRFSLNPWIATKFTRWYTYLFSSIKNYIFTSNYVYAKSKHLLPADISKIVIYNTVDLDVTENPDRAATEPLLISNVGYVDERKNQKLLIQIGDELRNRGLTNFVIWVIGDGPSRAEYEQLVDQLGLREQVKFFGQQADPWRLVAQTDLYIHTSLNDNCPYSIVEAFAVKTPVLALPVGGIPEMLPDHFGPLHGTDPKLLADQIAPYFNAAERRKLQQAQSVYADLNFDSRKSLTKLISFYQQTGQAA